MNEMAQMDSAAFAASGGASVPFDLPSALDGSEWRGQFRWPLAHSVLRKCQMDTVAAILDIAAEITDVRMRGLALLLQGHFGNIIRTIGELALLAEAADRQRVNFVGAPPELDYLRGKIPLSDIKPTGFSRKRDSNLNFAFGRRLTRTASWTRSPMRLAKAMIGPDHVAISHNGLMRDYALQSPQAIAFQHAEPLLQEGRSLAAPEPRKDDIREIVDRYELVFSRCYPVTSETLARMIEMYRQSAPAIAERGARDLDGLSRIKRLPDSLWAGSAGPYAVRALAIEVRRRGGKTTGFDHGGSLSMMDDPHSIALRELSVNDDYVLPSTECVRALQNTPAGEAARPFGRTELIGGPGDPTFRFPQVARSGASAKPRIYYIVTIFRALRQLVPTLLPDPVYLDWQLRLVAALRERGVDLISKPHPEGILKGKRHPLEDVGQIEYRSFEAIRDDADGFVYDYAQSTTFWEAVCTDRPITLIDFGITGFNATVRPLIERRCRVIKVRWDERNLPVVDFDELADAVTANGRADPTDFRALLAGNA
jgi:hypothetical protein